MIQSIARLIQESNAADALLPLIKKLKPLDAVTWRCNADTELEQGWKGAGDIS